VPSIKDVHRQEEGVIQCGQGEFFRCGRPRFFGAKNIVFDIYGVSAWTRGKGVEPVRTFCRQEERGSIFSDFVRTSFMEGHLFWFFNAI